MTHDVDTLVVGAGAAGIGAARHLAASGASVLLLEAGGRIGGRAHTVTIEGRALDLGCGWLHSGERNALAALAAASGFTVDRRPSAWARQFRDLGFPPADQAAAGEAFERWSDRLASGAVPDDRASEALVPGNAWNDYIAAIAGFMSGVEPERISARDYAAYDSVATGRNWRVAQGYGTMIAASLPPAVALRTGTPVRSLALDRDGVGVATDAGAIHARAVVLTVSTAVLAGGAIALPPALDPWVESAAVLPLGHNEKLYLAIDGDAPFEDETHVLGDPRRRATGSYYIRPLGTPVIECFLGAESARHLEMEGPAAAFDVARDELAALFGSGVRRSLRLLAASHWSGTPTIGGAYSCALPGHAEARARLARPFENRIFFAGEATHPFDFTTAHGAYASGVRAAGEAVAALSGAAAR